MDCSLLGRLMVAGYVSTTIFMRGIWLGLTTVLGYLSGFLFLLVIGCVIDPIFLAALLVAGRKRGLAPETLLGYGIGFTAFVDVRLWGNLFFFRDPSLLFWTIAGFAIGPALLAVGLLILWRRGRRPTN